MRLGFDNQQYILTQSRHIRERIAKFDNKLYLEFGGKLYDDHHASRVLPGFEPDSKLRMLLELKDQVEIVIVINSEDIEKKKMRSSLGITYESDVLRLKALFEERGLYVGSVCLTRYTDTYAVEMFLNRMKAAGIRVYKHYAIPGYPNNVKLIVSENGYGRNEYIETTRPLVVITAPGPGSGKMATCLSQLYHELKRGVRAGYAKFETFPIWNLALNHPVNLAYEAATADLNDVNMIDPYHLEAYGKTAVNYNRDVEIFPVLKAIFERIYGASIYQSPTDMGVNMAGYCITDDEVCREASRQEVLRRMFYARAGYMRGKATENENYQLELLMNKLNLHEEDRPVVPAARARAEETQDAAAALQLDDGTIVTGKTTPLLGACTAMLINALKLLAGLEKSCKLLMPQVIEPIQDMKVNYLGSRNPRMHMEEALIALSACATFSEEAKVALAQLPKLRNAQAHSTVLLSAADEATFQKLGIALTSENYLTDAKEDKE